MKRFCSVLRDLTCEGGALTKNPAHYRLLLALMGTLIECVFMPVCNLERRLLKQADTINRLQLATGASTSVRNKMLFLMFLKAEMRWFSASGRSIRCMSKVSHKRTNKCNTKNRCVFIWQINHKWEIVLLESK